MVLTSDLSLHEGLRRGMTLAVLLALVPLLGCEPRPKGPGGHTASLTCPRPQTFLTTQAFNVQEQEIRALRRQAFAGDFFAQIDLARRYGGSDAEARKLHDPVEAAVWYQIALSNPDGYAPVVVGAQGQRRGGRLQDCREAERLGAYNGLEHLLGRMSSEERQDVRDRVIYVLSTQGAPGFRTLARLHDVGFGPFGDPLDNSPIDPRDLKGRRPPASATLFTRNDVDVYLFNYLAAQSGDVAGFVMLKDFERSSSGRAALGTDAQAKAKRWTPPFEFYPPQAPESGVPLSDESLRAGEAEALALARVDELPFIHVGHALAFLRVTDKPALTKASLSTTEVQAFQAMLGRPTTGRLSSLEEVRAIQYAAVNGQARSQLTLAVMYAEGVGVPRDYARAFHWFSQADRQGNAEAKYAMSTFFSLGMEGVADQDKASAVVYQIDAALAGFKPSAQRLRELLAQVSRAPRT
ncbi:MAG: tetratricopeptide repeat protein [Phenylobacterium sp.]|uniref:tetratricopeptide repeat protein n=1 Tax=Phenylobacterium sp. TaxID=1871053 RepID=UPI002725C0D3|nr:tetratricopeptide repeat protein [Phenylobacterium sp.]MDO8902739.1 tetratricopeptide repeat protein [Phenylobacterium sp.]